jgi:Flp pilus assembly protein TadD/GTP-binding protein EngB required for normal cell division
MGIIERIAGTLDGLAGEGDGEARAALAHALATAERGRLEDAEQQLAELAARHPKLGAVHYHLGRLRARRGALEEAVASLGRAVDLDRDVAEAWQALGEALARLGRTEPARDALRHALALGTSSELHGRAHAALGHVHAQAGQLGKAVRDFRKALELLGDDAEVELAYGRALARLGEGEADEWLTRAARRPDAPPALYAEAAAASADPALAERLLREGVGRAPDDGDLRAALARHLAHAGRADEALGLALASVQQNPSAPAALAAMREAYAGAQRWREALAVAAREREVGVPPPATEILALALAAHDREALAGLAADERARASLPFRSLEAFLAGTAGDDDRVALARVAPDVDAQRFVVATDAPAPPPGAGLVALLGWAHAFAARTPALVSLAPGAGRALEAFDRPLLVAVMGEFNAGKSSFVNALVGEEVAPTGVTPTTATVNVLRHGERAGARVQFHDGTTRELGPASVSPFLRELSDAQAAAVRLVEVFHPLEALRRVEIVDTPGLNSIRPEHERVARDFLVEADALVWVFAIGQAAKASEREALALAHAGGKHVLGVLNKIDGASEDDVGAVIRHVQGAVGALVDEIVPFSATRALAARRAGKPDAAAEALEAALERRFFGRARSLKRATALASLERFVAGARAAAPAPIDVNFGARRAGIDALDTRLRGALARERVALRARIDEAYRVAAFEVRDFVRPRAWLFGEHRAEAADEQFLVELLEDAVERATLATRVALYAAVVPPDAPPESLPIAVREEVARAIDTAVARFDAYAHGVVEGGAVAEFFRSELPRIALDAAAIRNALARRAPDPERALFAQLAHDLAEAFRRAHAALDADETEASIRRLLVEERLEKPLAALAHAVAELQRGDQQS